MVNDLWKYDGNSWTWVSGSNKSGDLGVFGTKGIADSSNVVRARSACVMWVDSRGVIWIFGGALSQSVAFGLTSDLWSFDGTMWTWVSGPELPNQPGTSYLPGARERMHSWLGSDDSLWMFGGSGVDENFLPEDFALNDVWRFKDGNWSVIKYETQFGEYRQIGVVSNLNYPPAVHQAAVWQDSKGNFYVFSGETRNPDVPIDYNYFARGSKFIFS